MALVTIRVEHTLWKMYSSTNQIKPPSGDSFKSEHFVLRPQERDVIAFLCEKLRNKRNSVVIQRNVARHNWFRKAICCSSFEQLLLKFVVEQLFLHLMFLNCSSNLKLISTFATQDFQINCALSSIFFTQKSSNQLKNHIPVKTWSTLIHCWDIWSFFNRPSPLFQYRNIAFTFILVCY